MKLMLQYIMLLFLSLAGIQAAAQIVNIGNVISWKKNTGGMQGKTSAGMFEIKAYSENIIRVRLSREKTFRDFLYALKDDKPAAFNGVTISEERDRMLMATSFINLEIEKAPSFRLIFRNKKNEIINEDVKGAAFGTSYAGDKVTVYKKLQQGERFVGLGEALGNLNRRGSGVTLNNTDTYKYGDPRLSMYSSIPFYMGMHNNMVYGIFLNNSYKSFFNFGLSTPDFSSVSFDGGDMDYFFIYDTSVAKIIEHYTSLTGRTPLPPKWSLGYHQSRCSYYPQQKVMQLATTFRQKNIPVDCIVLDADYQQDYEPFRTNKERFPDMPALSEALAKMDIELTASVYPGVKIDSSYDSYTDGLQKDIFIKYADGRLFETEIAPLKVLLPDYTNPNTRNWWVNKMKWMQDNGISGYWNDMNEPAVGGSYLPDNLLFDFDGRKATAAEAKNVYGFQMARSSYEAGLKYRNGKRPFVLTRSAFAGVQRYSAVWSGDNTASNEGLLSSVLLNNQLGLSGIAFAGPDLGGYIGDGSKELFKRWMQVGVFSPYVRNHKEYFAPANEPWSYGEEAEAISKAYIGFRYRLMPYIYSKFYEASQTGIPVARSLCINDPFDEKVYDNLYQHQFLFGDAIMVVPVTTEEKIKKLYLPNGEWYHLFTDEKIAGAKEFTLETTACQIPLFVKASAIIPMQSLVQSAKQLPSDTLTIHIYNGKDNNNFIFYEDAGDGFEYKNGVFAKRTIHFNPQNKQVRFSKQEGSFVSGFKKLQLLFHGFEKDVQPVSVNGTAVNTNTTGVKLFDALEHLEGWYDKNYFQSLRAAVPQLQNPTIIINNTPDEIIISWKK